MSPTEEPNTHPRNKWLVPALLIIGALIAGVLIGRSTLKPQIEREYVREYIMEPAEAGATVITETVTVTVEVEVTSQPVLQDTQETGQTAVVPTATKSSGNNGPTSPPLPIQLDFNSFYETWAVVESLYDGDMPDSDELMYSAIEGSLEILGDEYTRFVRPDIAARMREDAGGSVEGIGAFVFENEEGRFEIVRPIPGQPAEKAGILPEDVVISVDGQSVESLTFDEVILMVRGPVGTTVTLGILRGEEELSFTITRVRFEVPTVEYEMLDQGIAYIHLQEFNQTATTKTVAALEELLAQNPQALIFDLRDNPGGFLNESVSIADLFLSENVILFERNRNGLDQSFTAVTGDIGEQIPMVVLINPGSASASEIVAGALQDHGRAVLIGETSFGKGSVQQIHQLSDGSEVRVTIARWYTPANNTIDKEGVTPDIELPMAFDAEEDIQLQRAIEYILTGE